LTRRGEARDNGFRISDPSGGTTDVQKVIMSRRIGIGRSVQEQAGRLR